ncbi:4-oxalocrotonate tautomerase DmpI [Methanosphaera sp. WGK6]|uniref:4-oxalocrotonate tautomerase DmpI n=1 Tax=Methanosphaera sp. WGK6 TaxID=1561964 RepID=UPI00084C3AB7|nr:4-oxalocrotonate tautomerase DmpI [Methanosphaera sp. WGK6]OED29824.1 4-oxalocrotonate tautomerase [Methanosphaera sp. WGK6]
MPIITIEGVANATKETKKEIIEKVSKVVSEEYDVPIQAISVIIHDVPADNVGVAGKQLSEIQQ